MSQSSEPAKAQRRRVFAAAGLAAALAGAGWAWWRTHGQPPSEDPSLELTPFRQQKWIGPDDQPLAWSADPSRPLLVNFWATWCPPCVRELPALDQFAQAQAARGAEGWQVLGLAIDRPGLVRDFLTRQPVRFPVAVLGMDGLRWARLWGNSAGGLPFTVVIRGDQILRRKSGESTFEELMTWAA